ncbi:MAG: hypothetical protein WA459_00505 [Stellaceae bacterium]
MKPSVETAIAELRAAYPGRVQDQDLGDGGAKVVVIGLSLNGSPYAQSETWCGFTITHAHPYADIYPHFVRPDLSRRDRAAFGQSFHPNTNFYKENALMLSRRTRVLNNENPVSAVLKLEKVLKWLISQ